MSNLMTRNELRLFKSVFKEWKRLLPYHLNTAVTGTGFYSQVYHPAFNLDAEDAIDAVDRFQRHLKEVDKGVQCLRAIFEKVRNTRLGESQLSVDYTKRYTDV